MSKIPRIKNICFYPLTVIFLFFCLTACSSENTMGKGMRKMECETMTEVPEWLNKKLSQVVEKLGSSSIEETFDMNDVVINEFRGKLEVLFPLSTRGNEPKWIKETSWYQGDCILTLWFEKQGDNWIVVDTLRWHKDSEF